MAVKVPSMLHKMSVASQKAWYKKNKMEYPGASGSEGKSAAQAKKDVGEINKKKAREAAIAKAATTKKNKELVSSSERVRAMRKNADAWGGGLGGGLDRNRDIISYVRAGGTIKAGRLGEADDRTQLIAKIAKDVQRKKTSKEITKRLGANAGKYSLDPKKDMKLKPSSPIKVDMSARQDRQISYQYEEHEKQNDIQQEEVQMNEVTKAEAEKVLGGPVKEKPKMPPGKQPAAYRYVRSLARKAMKAGMKKEEFEQVEETSDLEKLGKKYAVADKKEKEKESAGYTGKYPGGKEQKEKDKDAFLKRFAKEEVVLEFADEPKHSADAGEYDYEGDMAKSQLRSILANAKRLHDMLEENTNLPEWVQSKITLAEDYILTAANYMEGEMNEEFTDEKLSQIDEKAMSDAQMKKREKYVKSMKPVSDWEKRYPGRGEQVMYATATKMAMKEEAEVVEKTTEEVEQIEEKYMGFKALKASIAAKGGVRDPAAVAAAIGRKKYGKEKFQAMAAAGKKAANEEVEQVEEGYVVKYHDVKGVHKNTSKVFDDKASAAAKAEKGNSVDKVGGKYTVHKISEKGSEMKEALDPVGKENKDVDNDGDSDKTDSYLLNRRNAVRNAIRSKLAKKLGK